MTPSKGARRQRGGGIVQGGTGPKKSPPPCLESQPCTLGRRWMGLALKKNTFVIPSVWDGACLQMAADTLSVDGSSSQREQEREREKKKERGRERDVSLSERNICFFLLKYL